ncbi:MAG: AMP-binding protein, partial [Pseudomonadota bacterium]
MQTIPGVLSKAAQTWPDRPALIDGDQRYSFATLDEAVDGAARAMCAAGLEKGDRFAIWAPNIADWVIAALAGQRVGGVLVTVNTRFKGAEAADLLRRSEARFLFTVTDFLGVDYPELLEGEALPDLERTIVMRGPASGAESFEHFLSQGEAVSSEELSKRAEAVTGDDIADIIFTSGTT